MSPPEINHSKIIVTNQNNLDKIQRIQETIITKSKDSKENMNKVHDEFEGDRNNLLNEVKRTSRKERD